MILNIFHIDQQSVHRLDTLPKEVPSSGYLWLDFTRGEQHNLFETVKQLCQVDIHERHLEDQVTVNHPSAFDSMYDYDFLVFRSVKSIHMPQLQTDSCAFFLIDDFLISVHNPEDEAIPTVVKRLSMTHRRIPQYPEALLEMILDTKVDQFLGVRTLMGESLARWQNKLLTHNKPFKNWDEIMEFKGDIQTIRTLCEEQEDVLRNWRYSIRTDVALDRQVVEHLNINLSDISEHIRRVLRHAQKLESDLEALLQLHFSIISNQTNEVMRVLALMSSIFLPTTLVTGIFGMNFIKMPGLDNPHGYDFTLVGMIGIAISLIIFFKLKKWL
ncbi:magnesium transporter CorA family protein [Piscirickettsia salmonis]|uniref:magnesium transporter CorA family protein n=1 Tax=Piscirickettsia salmonis TaxID=1238 RepID=UPI000F0767C0|nr:magnesium transporter CorA family protein [Piscirickettsia salmonis]RNC78042.1 magnesium transporter CorA [Piscirickettsiaceae bacterium NZ-RLO2]WGZ71457.1 magnesium transporter CorA [Piscirickettsia salmonis EM-90]